MVPDLVTAGDVAAPDVRRDASPGIDIDGKETSKVNVAIGLSILGSFIGALGGGKLGLDAAFNKARTVTFQYTAVMEDAVDVLALEKFVKAGRISPHIPSGTLEKLLDDEVYVVTSVLKTKKIVVSAQGESGAAVKVDVPVIQQAVGGNLKVDTAGTRESRVAFEGAVPVAFAFQAVQLVFDDSGEFLTTQQLPAGDAAARALPSAACGSSRRAGAVPCFSKREARSCASLNRRRGDRETRDGDPLRQRPEPVGRRSAADSRVRSVRRRAGRRSCRQGKTEASTVELRLQLPFDAGQVYGLTFSAPRHRPAWQLLRRLDFIRTPEQVEGDDLILRLMLVPDSPGTTDVPNGLERLEQIASPFAAPGTGIDAARFQRARRGRQDGVPQHRGEAARNRHRWRAADVVRSRASVTSPSIACSCCSTPG